MEYLMARLRHEMLKRKKTEPRGEDVTIVLQHGKNVIHLYGKESRRLFIAANRDTLRIFATRQITKKVKIFEYIG